MAGVPLKTSSMKFWSFAFAPGAFPLRGGAERADLGVGGRSDPGMGWCGAYSTGCEGGTSRGPEWMEQMK